MVGTWCLSEVILLEGILPDWRGHGRCNQLMERQCSTTWSLASLDLEKAEEPEIQLPTSVGSSKKQESSRENIYFIDYVKAFDCVDHNKLENCSRDGNTRPPDLPPENLDAGQEATELNMDQQTGSKLGKEYVKAVYCHSAYLTSM